MVMMDEELLKSAIEDFAEERGMSIDAMITRCSIMHPSEHMSFEKALRTIQVRTVIELLKEIKDEKEYEKGYIINRW